jgi:4-amino-4-deoxy-L-arabinose transferase-like glycosyltransferase
MFMKNKIPAKGYLYVHPWMVVAAIISVSVAIKLVLMLTDRLPFNADEAVVGLMADHILKGEIPVFFWGQSYMGSLDAMLVAGAFLLFGRSVTAIRVVQILLYCGTIATTYLLAYRVSRKVVAGWMAALLMAIPTVNVTLYTTISLGGYGEALLLGNLILLSGFALLSKNTLPRWLTLGVLSGFGLWVNGLTLVYSVPAFFIAFWKTVAAEGHVIKRTGWQSTAIFFAGCLLGAIPWLLYGFQYGFGTLLYELMGSAIASQKIGYLSGVGTRLVSFLLFGITAIFGFRPPWEIRWLVLPMIPLIGGIWVLIIIGYRKLFKGDDPENHRIHLLFGVVLTLSAGFIFTSFGNDPSGRYFMPVAIPLAVLAGNYLAWLSGKMGRWRWPILGVILVFHLAGTVQCWQAYPPGFTTQFDANTIHDQSQREDLIDFLKENSLDRGYSSYWLSYPLAFLSEESLIFVPRLPYHNDFTYTDRDSRYPAYEEIVRSSRNICYITSNQPWLDTYLREHFSELNIHWNEQAIGEFLVFYGFDQAVEPEKIGLKVTD